MNVIQAKNLKRCYMMGGEPLYALNDISLEVKENEMVAIMGSSGSGKSTLMHLLGCLDRPTEGKFFFHGEDISLLDDVHLSHLRATKIGFIFQSFNLIPQLNILENVLLPFSYQSHRQKARQLAEKAIERVGLSKRLYHRPIELSGGEMQRVAIARALAINPLLILADEPTGNLDHANSLAILKLFQTLHEEGATIVLVTHDDFVAQHCKRLIRMKDGKIIEDGAVG